MTTKHLITIVLILILFTHKNNITAQVSIGDKAPALSIEEWLKGEPVTNFESGKVYLVEFWGTWCAPCIENIPHLSSLQEKFASSLTIIGVATHEFDGRDKLDNFMKKRGDEMRYTVAYDSDYSMQIDWDTGTKDGNNFRLPLCFLIDKTGTVLFAGHPADENLETLIEKAVK